MIQYCIAAPWSGLHTNFCKILTEGNAELKQHKMYVTVKTNQLHMDNIILLHKFMV